MGFLFEKRKKKIQVMHANKSQGEQDRGTKLVKNKRTHILYFLYPTIERVSRTMKLHRQIRPLAKYVGC